MFHQPQARHSAQTRPEVLNAFMRGVYRWMGLGLGLTALIAWFTASSPAALGVLFSVDPATGQVMGLSMLYWGLLLGELGLVMYLSMRIHKLSGTAASGLFLAYSALNGVTLSTILLAYTAESVFQTFAISAGMFAAMSIYGATTKRDLTSMGSFMTMGLIGIIIAMIVNMFLQSSAMGFAISVIGVIVFTGLTAYDTQKLKDMGASAPLDDATAMRRGTILGALTLYLDFINLFLMMLRLFGSARD